MTILHGDFYFLEVNTRLQVEHGVTEEVTGVDLVEWMVRQAAGEMTALDAIDLRPSGSSIQVRIYAEDAAKNFQPSAGRLTHVAWPKQARVETWVDSGTEVTPFYDPMLAKVIVHGATRAEALASMRAALGAMRTLRDRNQSFLLAASVQRSGLRPGRRHHFVPARFSLPAARHRRDRAGNADHGSGLSRDDWATGMSACLRPDQWTRWPSASPIAW